MDIKISVIVPVYNTEKYLRQCIESILSQSFADFEFILVDDGSTDSSLAICREYEAKDRRIRVIHQENRGVCAARNAGMDASNGEFLTFVDADDYLTRDALEHMIKGIERGGDIALGNVVKIRRGVFRQQTDWEGGTVDITDSMPQMALWGYCFRREILDRSKVRFIEGLAYSEDRIFLYELALFCRSITFIPQDVYIYRSNEYSVTHNPNGIRHVIHQFRAANIVNQMAKMSEYSRFRNALIGERLRIQKYGFYSLISNKPSWEDYDFMRSKFMEYFGEEYPHPLLLYYRLIITRQLLFRKRKFIDMFRRKPVVA